MSRIPFKRRPVLLIILPGNVASWVREIENAFGRQVRREDIAVLEQLPVSYFLALCKANSTFWNMYNKEYPLAK